ncbi:hypothetical protein ACFQ0M_18040 [Kitasatospora aburaviensis]
MLGPARAELALVAKLLELGAYDEPLGRALYGTAGRFARLAGWAAYDLGHDAAAQRAFVAALRAAHLSGDRRLGVGVVGGLVVLATQSAGGRGWTPSPRWPAHWRRPGTPSTRPTGRCSSGGSRVRTGGGATRTRCGRRRSGRSRSWTRLGAARRTWPGSTRRTRAGTAGTRGRISPAWWGRATSSSATTGAPSPCSPRRWRASVPGGPGRGHC